MIIFSAIKCDGSLHYADSTEAGDNGGKEGDRNEDGIKASDMLKQI